MPTYEYRCTACGKKLEAFQKISDSPLKTCESCGQDALSRGPGGGIGFTLQGGGWYKSNYDSASPAKDSPPSACCPCGKNAGGCSSSKAD